MAMAVIHALSEHFVKGEIEKVKEDFSFALRLLFFITVPAMIGLIALNVPIVSTLFQRGKFDYLATIGTSDALIFYSLGIWAIVGVRVISATFYSMQDTKTPVKVATTAILVNIVMSLLLMNPMKHNGLAFANSIASVCNFALLFYFLRKKLGSIGTKMIFISLSKTLFASAVMAVTGWFIVRGEIWKLSGYGFQKAAHLGGTIIVCVFIYLAVCHFLKSEEMSYIMDKFKSIKSK
jgi:putative peptidoglycan lipid II flippase